MLHVIISKARHGLLEIKPRGVWRISIMLQSYPAGGMRKLEYFSTNNWSSFEARSQGH